MILGLKKFQTTGDHSDNDNDNEKDEKDISPFYVQIRPLGLWLPFRVLSSGHIPPLK